MVVMYQVILMQCGTRCINLYILLLSSLLLPTAKKERAILLYSSRQNHSVNNDRDVHQTQVSCTDNKQCAQYRSLLIENRHYCIRRYGLM